MFNLIKDISTNQADLIKSFAIFYLILIGNLIPRSIFPCFQIKFISIHKKLQLFIAFLLFYFLVTLVSNTGNREYTPPIEKLMYSVFYFIGFLLLMRLDMNVSTIVLILIFTIYFIELNKDFYLEGGINITNAKEKEDYEGNQFWITINWPFKLKLFPVSKNDFKILNKVENIIFYIIMIILIAGFISYGGEIKDTLKQSKKLTWINVLLNTDVCNLKDKKSFWDYFKIGLGLSI
jgi:hypothetical protein